MDRTSSTSDAVGRSEGSSDMQARCSAATSAGHCSGACRGAIWPRRAGWPLQDIVVAGPRVLSMECCRHETALPCNAGCARRASLVHATLDAQSARLGHKWLISCSICFHPTIKHLMIRCSITQSSYAESPDDLMQDDAVAPHVARLRCTPPQQHLGGAPCSSGGGISGGDQEHAHCIRLGGHPTPLAAAVHAPLQCTCASHTSRLVISMSVRAGAPRAQPRFPNMLTVKGAKAAADGEVRAAHEAREPHITCGCHGGRTPQWDVKQWAPGS